jgi:ABC-type amino acid transport substrate-binding protein
MKRSLVRERVAGLPCVAVLVALGLGACGSSGTEASRPAANVSADSHSAAALLPARIAKSKTLVVGVLSGGSSAMDSTSGSNIVGFDPDLIKAIGNELGVKVEIKPAAFDSLIAGVQAARYDVTIGGMGDTKERQKSVSFVDYLNIGVAMVVKKGNPPHIQASGDLCAKSVAVLTGGYPQTTLVPQLSAQCTKSGKPAVHTLNFNDVNSAVLAVQSGRADCLYDDTAAAAYLLKTAGGEFEQVGSSQTLARTGIAFDKKDLQLGNAIKAAIEALMKSGQYATIAKRWELSGEMIPAPTINKALI